MKPYTPERLERALRRRLLDPKTRIKLGPVKGFAGTVEWTANPSDGVDISVNPQWAAVVGTVIHELVHVELETFMEPLGDEIEELAVEAISESLAKRVYHSKRRSAWWERHVKARVRTNK